MSKLQYWKDRMGHVGVVAMAACLISAIEAAPAYAQEREEGIAERIGSRLDRGIDRLSEELREGWESLQKYVDTMGVKGRVYSRLRWDKHLAESEFDLDVEEGGVVVLRGRVPSTMAKEKAIQLSNDTVGVSRVVDELRVEAPPEDGSPSPER